MGLNYSFLPYNLQDILLKISVFKTSTAIKFSSRSYGRNLAGLSLLTRLQAHFADNFSTAGVFKRTKWTALSFPARTPHRPPRPPRRTEPLKAWCELRPWAAASAPTVGRGTGSHRTQKPLSFFFLSLKPDFVSFPSLVTGSSSTAREPAAIVTKHQDFLGRQSPRW